MTSHDWKILRMIREKLVFCNTAVVFLFIYWPLSHLVFINFVTRCVVGNALSVLFKKKTKCVMWGATDTISEKSVEINIYAAKYSWKVREYRMTPFRLKL